ncbi:MAG: transglycosylase SLT domain-containing protein [Gammaproteobacteria bacterium]|nr:transglycosylase SLT domain-containing protein [Gammaproteobacteria bacterium]
MRIDDRSLVPGNPAPRILAVLLLLVWLPAAAGAAVATDLPADEVRQLRLELADVLAAADQGPDRFDAEVWLTAQEPRMNAFRRFLPDPDERLDVLGIVWEEATRHGIDPEFALALIEVESSFDRYAISSAGARGLMQVMPFWKAELGRREDNLTDPVTNVRYGMTILAHYLERESGDVVRALTRYHGDRSDLSYPRRVFAAWNQRWRTRAPHEVRGLLASCYRARLDSCD